MAKAKVSFPHIVKHWFTFHPWLKLISLMLAIAVWFYVQDELNRFNY